MSNKILQGGVGEQGDGGRSGQPLSDAAQHHTYVTVKLGVLPALGRTLTAQVKELTKVDHCLLQK